MIRGSICICQKCQNLNTTCLYLRQEKFDLDDWANLFRRAGTQFVVLVAEHHDGFAMYDTALSEWNAARMGPKCDVIAELALAVRKQWLTFGLSSHRAEHW